MMELLSQGGEHHEIGDGGRLMMTMATDSPLRSPERTGCGPPGLHLLQRIFYYLQKDVPWSFRSFRELFFSAHK